MTHSNPQVDRFLSTATRWRDELTALRHIVRDCPLNEELKWGKPCYTFEGSNVLILQGFKDFCALLFTKGALLDDPAGILRKPGENTQSARRVTFTCTQAVGELEPVLKAYIEAAIDVEKAGLTIDFNDKHALTYPEELQRKLDEDPALKAAFEGLTPGRRRAYNLYFSGARQSSTRESRIEKCRPKIMDGLGPNDR
ncbi:hypothetical protein EZI54_19915 [Marinobacter halodurans]|uniref:YdhG-like domain-containing protein n=1 Tax=Marinobacter halodurans TaxID=2528979 RepID=A0ABY1ZFB2_9GAMM|nr:YdeI/OmpD-associated family protein [Marinobacter halodurans]TBW49393.1 hypothetical protein EZI54_19915 [Marinobacter halodurans]